MGWHERYRDRTDPISARLSVVQELVAGRLRDAGPGALTVIDVCAGQGEVTLAPIQGHGRERDVRLLLVELDPANGAVAIERASRTDAQVDVVIADAGEAKVYAEHVPADLVVLSGVLGHLSDVDRRDFVGCLPMLCKPGGHVIWSRNPARAAADRRSFEVAGFVELSFDVADSTGRYGVGCSRFDGEPSPLDDGRRFFTFLNERPLPSAPRDGRA